jgi:hypothetical protein
MRFYCVKWHVLPESHKHTVIAERTAPGDNRHLLIVRAVKSTTIEVNLNGPERTRSRRRLI